MRKKIIEYYSCFLLVVLVVISCQNSGVEPGASGNTFKIEDSDLTQDFTNAKTDVIIPLSTDIDDTSWSVLSSEPEWCMATKSVGSSSSGVRLYILENQEPDVRDAVVEVKSSIKTYEINVRQLGYGKAILIKESQINLDDEGGEILVTVTSNVTCINKVVYSGEQTGWIEDITTKTRALEDKDYNFKAGANFLYQARDAQIIFEAADDESVSASCGVTQGAKQGDASDVVVDSDIVITPIGGASSSHQDTFTIDKCWDGILSGTDGFFHAGWGTGWGTGTTNFPVTMEFYFDGTQDIDYINYFTLGSKDGFIGEFDLYVEQDGDGGIYKYYDTYDFNESPVFPGVLKFEIPLLKVKKIKIEAKSGYGGYLSCAEVQFRAYNEDKVLEELLLTVFTDICCTDLIDGVTTDDINQLPGYFALLATAIKNGEYSEFDSMFRIKECKAYSEPVSCAEEIRISNYSVLDNPTGICVEAGDEIIVLVGDTYGQTISLQNVAETEDDGDKYLLYPGVNKIEILTSGALFVAYNTDISSSTAKPIKIHIPLNSGWVNGYFDLEEHKTDEKYATIVSQAKHKFFAVKGQNVVMNFHLEKFLQLQPTSIVEYIEFFDNIVNWEYELMGIEEYRPSTFNNHIYAYSAEDGYMWKSGSSVGFGKDALDVFMPVEKMYVNRQAWGPAHEIGHVHQRAIGWIGCLESSNNLYSNYVLYKVGTEASNGPGVNDMASIHCIEDRPWLDFLGDPDSEDTNNHMRMYWQLFIYFHLCEVEVDFWPELHKILRNRPEDLSLGVKQMEFVKYASDVAKLDLSEFFTFWGFLTPIDTQINQYGSAMCTVTDAMIAETKEYVSKYSKAAPFQYIEDRKKSDSTIDASFLSSIGDVGHMSQYTSNAKVANNISYVRSGDTFMVSNGGNAVAFELYDGTTLKYFSTHLTFTIPSSLVLSNSAVLKAVQADGERIIVSN